MSLFSTIGNFVANNRKDLILGGLAGAANIYGGYRDRETIEDAAKLQSAATREALEAQNRASAEAIERQRPYTELGAHAAGELQGRLSDNALLGNFTGEDLANEPGYQFELQEGNQAIDRAAGARGGRYSGGTLKALQRYGQGLAQQNYGEAFNRDNVSKTRQYNMLGGSVDAGQGASSTVGGFLQNQGTNQARHLGTLGEVGASRTIAGNNALTRGYGNAANNALDIAYGGKSPFTYTVR
tara:strand:- start:2220 stop:2942 length:723 start_codon:yes stop_codon:yes gene_type:complete